MAAMLRRRTATTLPVFEDVVSEDPRRRRRFTIGLPFALLFFISAGALYFFPALLSFSFLPSTLSFAPRPSRNAGFVERIDPLALSQSWNSKSRAQERFFEWNVTRGLHSADGVLRETYLVNGVFPGPAIEANEGDTLLVRLRNTITPAHTKSNNSPGSVSEPDEDEGESGLSLSSAQFLEVHPPGTEDKLSIHWHGLSMRDSVGMDGSSGLTQCGVTPGKEITYRFRLSREDVGTHWWHSHIGTQRVDGLWGALIVHARNKWDQTALSAWKAKEAKSPAAKSGAAAAIRGKLDWSMEMVVAVGDHYHRTGSEVLAWYMSTYSLGFEPVPENGLINGHNVFNCDRSILYGVKCHNANSTFGGRHAEFKLERGERYRLRLVNVGAVADMIFSIDGHELTVIEADGVLVEPVTVHRLSIAPGQRYSVLVSAPSTSGSTSPSPHDKSSWWRNLGARLLPRRVIDSPPYALGPSDSEERRKTQTFWMRAELHQACFNYPNAALDPVIKAIVSYDSSADRSSQNPLSPQRTPSTTPWTPGLDFAPCRDLDPAMLTPLEYTPAPELHLGKGDFRTVVFASNPKLEKHGLVPMGYMNRTTWRPSVVPNLYTAAGLAHGNASATPASQLIITPHPSEPRVVELVINNLDESAHPMHLHGHRFWVMEQFSSDVGWGSYVDEGQSRTYDLDKAMLRDTVSVPRRGYVVLRWVADNPGVWAFHCHVLWHMVSGMAMAFIDMPDALRASHSSEDNAARLGISEEMRAMCPNAV